MLVWNCGLRLLRRISLVEQGGRAG